MCLLHVAGAAGHGLRGQLHLYTGAARIHSSVRCCGVLAARDCMCVPGADRGGRTRKTQRRKETVRAVYDVYDQDCAMCHGSIVRAGGGDVDGV